MHARFSAALVAIMLALTIKRLLDDAPSIAREGEGRWLMGCG